MFCQFQGCLQNGDVPKSPLSLNRQRLCHRWAYPLRGPIVPASCTFARCLQRAPWTFQTN